MEKAINRAEGCVSATTNDEFAKGPFSLRATVLFATAAFRKLFALSTEPVNWQASFYNRAVVRFTGARYGE
jgi:hypothetical protein